MASKAVVKQDEAKVPALAYVPKIEIEQEDLMLPKLKIGQDTSFQVKRQFAKRGDLFTIVSKEDPDPTILSSHGDGTSIVFHVLDMYKGKSLSEGGELEMWHGKDMVNAPPEAWTTYNYVLCLPEIEDREVPIKFLLTKSGKGTAQQINMVLKKEEGRLPAYAIGFELKTSFRSNAKGEWFVPEVRRIEQDDVPNENIIFAEEMAVRASGTNYEEATTTEDVAI